MSGASRGLLALLAGASIAVACGGLFTAHRAVQSAEMFKAEALVWHGKAQELQRCLEASQGIRAELEAKLKAKPVPAPAVGRAGTLSRAASNYVNVKAPSDHYWQGQVGRDRHGHAIFRSPEWSLRAGAIVLRNYAKRHNIHSVRGIVERFSTCNHDEYAAFLAKRLGVGENERIDVVKMMPVLLPAMVRFETGRAVAPEHVAILDFLKEG